MSIDPKYAVIIQGVLLKSSSTLSARGTTRTSDGLPTWEIVGSRNARYKGIAVLVLSLITNMVDQALQFRGPSRSTTKLRRSINLVCVVKHH